MDPNQQPQPQAQPQPQPQFPPQPQQPQQPQYTQVPTPEPAAYPQPPVPPVAPPIAPSVAPVGSQPFEAQAHPSSDSKPSKGGTNPGTPLGIASFALLFVGLGLVSVILGTIGLKKSKRAGQGNAFAIIGIIGGIVEIVAAIVLSVLFAMTLVTVVDTCKQYGSGTHTLIDGKTITCSAE